MNPLLSGVRILDLTRMLTGDYAAMLLGDLGAEVIKIEAPGTGDPLRQMPPHFLEGESAYFLSINRSKKSIILDLKIPEDKQRFYELVKKSDVVFDNFRPGILEKLGADYETLKKHNPKIICCSISSYGKTGPYKNQPGFDLVVQALSGSMSITGDPGHAPVRLGVPMGDLAGSMFAVFSIASALYQREQTGEGANIDISLLDSLVSMLTYVAEYYFIGNQVSKPIGSGHMSVVPYRAYETKNGYLVIAIFVEKFWQILCDVIGEPQLGDDERYNSTAKRLENRADVDKLLEDKFKTKTKEEWVEMLHKAGVPAAPVNRIDEVFKNEQVLARNMLVEIMHPKCGKFKMVGNPVKVEGVAEEFMPPPLLGEHTAEVMEKLLAKRKDNRK